MTLPTLIIAGVNKAGTTSLHSYLAEHPEVCGADVKETFFWNRLANWEKPDLAKYSEHFKHHSGEPIVLESTPRYFHDIADHLEDLDKHLGSNLKIILILREPIARLFSFYKFKKRGLEVPREMNFAQFVEQCLDGSLQTETGIEKGITEGFYADDYLKWKSHFGERLKVVFTDDLRNPSKLMSMLCSWLDIANEFYDGYAFPRDNQSMDFKNPLLQKTGIGVFRSTQRFWSMFPSLKRAATRIYLAINGRKYEEEVPEETKARLQVYYSEDLKSLREHLEKEGMTELPSWIG